MDVSEEALVLSFDPHHDYFPAASFHLTGLFLRLDHLQDLLAFDDIAVGGRGGSDVCITALSMKFPRSAMC